MPGFVGLPELLILGVVVLIIFGPKRLPEMGRSMGRGLREFKQSISDDKDEPDLELPVIVDEDEGRTIVTTAGRPEGVKAA
ncbi:MAG: twin-arginine translocase TatA/TatE family subunit [Gaiellaceae bacterium]